MKDTAKVTIPAQSRNLPHRFQRGMKGPDGRRWAVAPVTPLLSLTASRKPYAVVSRRVLADQVLGDSAFVLLAVMASLYRGKGEPLRLTAKELAASQGISLSAHYERANRLQVLGYLDAAGELSEAFRPGNAAKAPGGFVRVPLCAVHALPPAAVRALPALVDRCDGRNRSRARVATLAAASGRSVRAWYRAFAALVAAGWAWSRGRWRGLGRQPARADSGKRHTSFRKSSLSSFSRRDRHKESDSLARMSDNRSSEAPQPRRPTGRELAKMRPEQRIAVMRAFAGAGT